MDENDPRLWVIGGGFLSFMYAALFGRSIHTEAVKNWQPPFGKRRHRRGWASV